MLETLMIGFLLGMRHAMESDHVAAVASLVTRSPSMRQSIQLGSVWGLGHTATLFVLGSVVLLLDSVVPATMASMLELAVGVMLVGLGIDVMRRLRHEQIHMHPHYHADGSLHLHAHGHPHNDISDHHHSHSSRFPVRALLVGMMHGMAGSAALMILTLQSVHSFSAGMLYIALFGIGSIAGMALLSVVIMLPLTMTSQNFGSIHRYLQLTIASATIVLGADIVFVQLTLG